MNDSDVRDLLARIAEEVPATPVDPDPLLRRGYRRMGRTAVAAALGIAFAIVATVGGVGLIRSSAPTTIPSTEGRSTGPTGTTTGETTDTSTGPCFDSQDGPPTQVCLGPLDEGTYTSQRFEPALTFTVPAGWNNPWDSRGAFTLWTPGWTPGNTLIAEPGVKVRRDPRPEGGCVDATTGRSALELATWVVDHPAIAAGAPSPVEFGGLTGYQLDVTLEDTWRESCPGTPAIWLFRDLYLRDPNRYPELGTMRLILLDQPDGGSILIAIDEDRLDVAMPVVDSFVFDLG